MFTSKKQKTIRRGNNLSLSRELKKHEHVSNGRRNNKILSRETELSNRGDLSLVPHAEHWGPIKRVLITL